MAAVARPRRTWTSRPMAKGKQSPRAPAPVTDAAARVAAELTDLGAHFALPVSRVGHLLALKVLSESEKRLQDRIDIYELAKVATEEDWRTAEAAVRLIKERGYHRGRALVTRLRRWRHNA